MLFLPETPRYLVRAGRIEKARASLGFLHGLPTDHAVVLQELHEIESSLELERAHQTGYLGCWKPPFLYRQAAGCALQALQQLTGSKHATSAPCDIKRKLVSDTLVVNFIIYYGTLFFKNSGVENAFLTTIIINVVAFVSTVPGLYLVERMGRRNLLLTGAAGMAVTQLIIAIVGTTAASEVANKATVALVCIYIFFFEFSWGP